MRHQAWPAGAINDAPLQRQQCCGHLRQCNAAQPQQFTKAPHQAIEELQVKQTVQVG